MTRWHTRHGFTWGRLLLALICAGCWLAAPALAQQAAPPSAPAPAPQAAPPGTPAPAPQAAPPSVPGPAQEAAPPIAPAPAPEAAPPAAPAPVPQAATPSTPAPAQEAAPPSAPAPASEAAPPAAPAPQAAPPSAPGPAQEAAPPSAPAPDQAKAKEAFDIAVDAYIYGYPLVTMEMTRRVMTNVAKPEAKAAPMGQFANVRQYPDASFKDITAPNADTLYSVAWLDLAKEPYILSLPDEKGRYYLMPLISGWTEVFQVPGTRTTGTKAQKYAITGPNWQGKLPAGVKELKSPTSLVWILGRTYCTGTPADYQAVHKIQDQYKLAPLSAYGKPYTPPPGKVDPGIDMETPVREQVNKMGAGDFFKLLATLMKDNPPAKEDAPMLEKMAKIGVVPGQDFDLSKLDPAVAMGVQRAPRMGLQEALTSFETSGTFVNGWGIFTNTGVYGTDYLNRALIAAVGLGANRPQDAIYPTSQVDAEGTPYSGAKKYVMHFDKGQMPPVKAFWSLTMYNEQYYFVDNPLKRYNVSSRSKLKSNKDGSVDIYIQNESPGKDKESNWLPAPKEKFILMLRLYWPQETPPSIIDGSWKPPGVKVVE